MHYGNPNLRRLIPQVVLALLAVTAPWAWGQTTIRIPGKGGPPNAPAGLPIATGRPAARAPLPHLYRHFLLYQNFLDRAAAARTGQGKDGSALREHFQRKLGFSDGQFQVVRAAGLKLEADLKPINDKVRMIAQQDRDWRLLNGASRSTPPPGHQQMQQLRKDQDALIETHVAALNRDLGPARASRLQSFIETEWAQHVTVRTIGHMRNPDPKAQRANQLHMEARP